MRERMMVTMSRGSSIVAGLILVGILSALSVVLDQTAATYVARGGSESQVAQAAAPKVPVPKVGTKKEEKAADEDIRKCEPNFNYKVLVDPKSKDGGEVKVIFNGKTFTGPKGDGKADVKIVCVMPKDTGSVWRCPGTIDGCANSDDPVIINYMKRDPWTVACQKNEKACNDAFKQDWSEYCAQDSQLKYCTPPDLEKAMKKDAPDDKSCVYSSCNAKDDNGVVSQAKKGAAKNIGSLVKDTKDPETLKALGTTLGALKLDPVMTQWLLSGTTAEGARTAEQLVEARKELERRAAESLKQPENDNLNKFVEQQKARVKQLEEQSARLAALEKAIVSKSGPPDDAGKPPPTPLPGGPPDPPNAPPGGAGVSEACRRCQANVNDSIACQQCTQRQGGSTFPSGQQGQGGQQQGGQQQRPPQQQQPTQQQQQCYNGSVYSGQNNAYCSNGSIYTYNNQTCQYQVAQQCPSSQCNTQQLTTDMYGRQISTSCAPVNQNQNQTPLTAQLTCAPRRVELGSPVTLSFACSQGTATGNGFTANGQSGSGSIVPQKPPSGASFVTYGLTCTGTNGQTVQATPCQVEVVEPQVMFVAVPETVASTTASSTATLGWFTTGMQACVVQSTSGTHVVWNQEQRTRTNVSGVVKTPHLVRETMFELTCRTEENKEKKATVTVRRDP